MKKTVCLFVLASLIISISMLGCAQNNNEPSGEVGGYSEDREITEEELSMFEQVMGELVGVGYEPKLVATQVVAGTNYRFTATATPIAANAEPYDVYVYIFQPLDGPPELTEIVEL